MNIFHPGLFQNLLQSSQISLETPQSFLEPPKCFLGDSLAPRRPRARRPAGHKTGPWLFLCAFTMIFLISLTQVNLYEDVPLISRKISAYDCLCLSFVGDVFLRIKGQAHVPREPMTQLPNHLLNKWQTAKRGGGIAALLRFG